MHDFLEQCHAECVLCDSVFSIVIFQKMHIIIILLDNSVFVISSAFGPADNTYLNNVFPDMTKTSSYNWLWFYSKQKESIRKIFESKWTVMQKSPTFNNILIT